MPGLFSDVEVGQAWTLGVDRHTVIGLSGKEIVSNGYLNLSLDDRILILGVTTNQVVSIFLS